MCIQVSLYVPESYGIFPSGKDFIRWYKYLFVPVLRRFTGTLLPWKEQLIYRNEGTTFDNRTGRPENRLDVGRSGKTVCGIKYPVILRTSCGHR